MTYIFEFDILPGKNHEFWDFMEKEGVPFWIRHPEVESYEVFSKLGGSPLFEAHVELKSFEDFQKIRSDPDWGNVSAKTSALACNMQRRFILSERKFEKA